MYYTTIIDKLRRDLLAADSLWQQRKRKINTTCIFTDLTSAAIAKRGLRHILHDTKSQYTSAALGQARSKLPKDLFAQMNKSLHDSHYRQQNEPRVFAIDGSKVHVHPCFLQQGYVSRTNNQSVSRPAVRPLAMLSSMLDVKTRTCYDSQISAHFNERKSASAHMAVAAPGDTLLFDRGYYSNALLKTASQSGLRVVFRLKRDAFKGAAAFWNSTKLRAATIVAHSDGTCTPAVLVKYFIDGKKYMNLVNFCAETSEIKQLYALRWRVETSFKRLKSYLNLEDSHSMSAHMFIQEVQARILLDTVTQKLTAIQSSAPVRKTVSYLKTLDDVESILFTCKISSVYHLTQTQFRALFFKYHSWIWKDEQSVPRNRSV